MALAAPLEWTNQLYLQASKERTKKLAMKGSPSKNPKSTCFMTHSTRSMSAGKPLQMNRKPFTGKDTEQIININHQAVAQPRVAYQGVPGAYSEFAAKTAVPNCITVPCRTFGDTVTAVKTGRADRAILPVESTMEGGAVRNYTLLLQHDLQIVQEINLFVHYCLLAMPGVRKGELKRVISHPMALAHCSRTLAQLGLDVSQEPVHDTAGAVELLLCHRMLDTAAIASPRVAHLYGLQVLAHGLQDESWNVTRFLILSMEVDSTRKSGSSYKTSMVIARHGGTPEVLLRVLSAFSSNSISLTKLEVKPFEEECSRILDVHGGGLVKEFCHVLYVDFEGLIDDHKAKDAIAEISKLGVFIRVLGCYAADPKIYDLQ